MKYDYILEFVCDHLCIFADESFGQEDQEDLDKHCQKCKLANYMWDLEKADGEVSKSMQMEAAKILLRYLKEITNTDLALPEGQVRCVSEVALAINAILRDLQ